MAKTSTSKAPKSAKVAQVRPDKQQKKQLKHEANLKQKIKFTQKDLQKAERKVLKAKTDVDALAAQLQELNEKLAHNHTDSHTHSHASAKSKKEKSHTDTSEQASPVNLVPEETASSVQETPVSESTESTESTDNKPADGDSYEDSPAIEEMHQASLPPTEGRNDINENQDSLATAGATEEPKTDTASSAEEKSAADHEEPNQTEEHHTTSRRTSHRRTTTHETHES